MIVTVIGIALLILLGIVVVCGLVIGMLAGFILALSIIGHVITALHSSAHGRGIPRHRSPEGKGS